MKPKSKRQVLVCELSERLPKLASKLEPWAFKNCIDHVGYRNKMWTNCLCCGHVWPTTSMKIKTEVCPGCGWKLKLDTTRKQKSKDWARFAVLDVVEDFQVVRYFDINCHMKAKQKPSVYTREIMQQWILPDGNFEVISMQVGGMGLSYDHFGGQMTLKNPRDLWKYNISVFKIYPEMNLLPVYKRNGFSSLVTGISPFELLRNLGHDSKTETLLKAKQFALLSRHLGERASGIWRHWSSIKICLRNKYIVKSASTWLDYLDLLEYFGKDLRNAKYVCPKNLTREHDRLVKKKTAILKRQELTSRMKQLENDQRSFQKLKSSFFGITFQDSDLEVKVLESIQEFIDEAEAHKHCVYSNRYYAKPDSLILSARINGKPIETVEISLSKMQITQSRGLQNKATEYHDKIVELVSKGLPVISKKYRQMEKGEVAA
jgi:hypothetical protein